MGNQIPRTARNDLPLRRSPVTMEKVETKRRRIMNINLGRELPLPPHIVQVIFSKLPISNLPAYRLISRTWNDLILDLASTSKFLPKAFLLCTADFDPNGVSKALTFHNPKIHCVNIDTLSSIASFDRSKFDHNWSVFSIHISCNGLLYFSKSSRDIHYDGILNPMTNEFFKLPGPELEDIYYFGFGFSPKTKQYKLFKISFDKSKMEVFRFGRSSGTCNHTQWRHLRSLPFAICYNGAYLNGVIYWIGKQKGKENEYTIYSLDVETEQIQLIAVLEVGPYSKKAVIQPFNGTIYAIIFMYAPCPKILVWRMQGKDSWIRDFVIHDIPNNWARGLFHLVNLLEDGELLFLALNEFFCLDKTGRKIKIKTSFNRNCTHVLDACHIESFNFRSLPNIFAGDD